MVYLWYMVEGTWYIVYGIWYRVVISNVLVEWFYKAYFFMDHLGFIYGIWCMIEP